tara:strand:+ start:174 stop:893 length:720 start_codon:yes stop_codon:yes gene_type:complete
MEKNKLDRFINKYSLAGNANSVKWKSDNNKLLTSFVTEDKSLLGQVSVNNFEFEDCELGIYATDQLQKLLNVLSDNVKLSLNKFGEKPLSLGMKNDSIAVDFVLSDLSVIPEPPKMKKIPGFETKIKIDSSFINAFIKGKGALPDSNSFTVINDNGSCKIVIGYSNTTTNRVSIDVDCTNCDITSNISFNADLFKEILNANKECTNAVLEISNEGLAKINFKVDDFDAIYYMVANQEVD